MKNLYVYKEVCFTKVFSKSSWNFSQYQRPENFTCRKNLEYTLERKRSYFDQLIEQNQPGLKSGSFLEELDK